MTNVSREFQVFVKPAGARCNLGCDYCYYLPKEKILTDGQIFPMADHVLESYIRQHLAAAPGREVDFSWHGGEPTLLGIDFFRRVVDLQKKYKPTGKQIHNGLQTNGTLLDDAWGRFFRQEKFSVGLSLDGPRELHDHYRKTKNGRPTFDRVMNGYEILRKFGVHCDILCVVNDRNVGFPVEIYRFFKEIGARFISFLPLVEPRSGPDGPVSDRSVPAEAFGDFLCAVYDQWMQAGDMGRIFVQIIEETAQSALGPNHRLCLFRETCGDIPVVEINGDFYPCDHFVTPDQRVGNIQTTPLADLLESPAQKAFGRQKQTALPEYCRACDVLPLCNGECPKNRIIHTPDGAPGLNYLCAGYKRFFHHCRPFLDQLTTVNREAQGQNRSKPIPSPKEKIGRNDPCPCGSGKKYKKCCYGK